jgi:glycosyltransferase involved in cell wall biosynthesis
MNNLNGLSFHRLIVPFSKVSDMIDFQCDVFPDLDAATDEQLKQYSAVVYQREIDTNGKSLEIIKKYHSLGIKVIFDIDDIWTLPKSHYLSRLYEIHNIPAQTVEILKNVDLVITTTKHLASKIKKYNKNVEVIPNCLDHEDEQWKPNKTKSDKIRFGYIAGIFHKEDISILEMPIRKVLRHDINAQFVLGGYNDNADYNYYEKVMSGGTLTDKYQRVYSLPVHDYGKAYNETDVSLIPLQSNSFTECKSEIKLLEAGMHGNPVIVSDVLPYNIFPKETAIFLNNSDINGWYKAIRNLSKDESMRKEYAESLQKYIEKHYNINKWTQIRKQILQSVLA